MKHLVSIFIMFYSIQSFSKEIIGKITCYSNIKYAYINGILNYNKSEARRSSDLISKKVINSNEIITIFNQSEGFLEDIKRAIAQKAEGAGKLSFVGNLFIKSLGIRTKDNRVSINNLKMRQLLISQY